MFTNEPVVRCIIVCVSLCACVVLCCVPPTLHNRPSPIRYAGNAIIRRILLSSKCQASSDRRNTSGAVQRPIKCHLNWKRIRNVLRAQITGINKLEGSIMAIVSSYRGNCWEAVRGSARSAFWGVLSRNVLRRNSSCAQDGRGLGRNVSYVISSIINAGKLNSS